METCHWSGSFRQDKQINEWEAWLKQYCAKHGGEIEVLNILAPDQISSDPGQVVLFDPYVPSDSRNKERVGSLGTPDETALLYQVVGPSGGVHS